MTKKADNQGIIIIAMITFFIILSSCSGNWPQFRGSDFNMAVTGRNLPVQWGNDINVLWTYDLEGSSWSSPLVWGNKVFISTAFPEKVTAPAEQQAPPPPPPPPPQGGNDSRPRQELPPPPPPPIDTNYLQDVYRWELTCIDLKSGEELWKQVAYHGNPRGRKNPGATYANETPVTDGKRVYVYFGMIGLYCYDMDGNLLWQKDLGAYETLNGWGTGSSPVVYQDILYQQVDNEENAFIVALDAHTGEEIWKAGREEKTNYSTPLIWKNNIRTELVVSGKIARGYDLRTGEVLWELRINGEYNIPSPVADKDHLYLGNAGGREFPGTLFCVKAGARGDITPADGELVSSGVEWSIPDAGTGNPSPLLYDGLVYMLSSRGGDMSCFDASTGKLIYKEKVDSVASCWASPWAYKDNIYFMDEKGVTYIIKAGETFEVLSRNKLDDRFWASPAITRDAYIFKGVEKLYCVKN
ncbi:MAG: hypothetical protein AMS27_17345 [Bacteroides sp. SM23_62_1]|nr:MAG: hypothetical protein AMS27_17345 [Bacteroides sp. SM23_62_1]